MGNECSVCACNDQKDIDDETALQLEKNKKSGNLINEKK